MPPSYDEKIPSDHLVRVVIESVRILRGREKCDDQALAVYLAPYWLAWSNRKWLDGRPYDPGNISWLTKWALNGTVPPIAQSTGAGGEDGTARKDKAEVTKEVAGRKNGRGF